MSRIPNNSSVDTADTPKETRLSRSQQRQMKNYCETGAEMLGQGKKLQALEYFQAALEIDDACVEAWLGLISVYKALGKVNKAEEAQKKVALLLRGSVDLRKLERNKNRLLAKYKSKARRGLVKKGCDALGVGVYVFSAEAEAEMTKIEDDIKALNNYFTENGVESSTLDDIRKSCVDKRVLRSRKRALTKLKNAYRWMVIKSVAKPQNYTGRSKVTRTILVSEQQLRNKIAALDPKGGRDWCDSFSQRMQRLRREIPLKLPKVLKTIGIVLCVGLGLLLVYYVIKYFIYFVCGALILLILIGMLSD